MCVCVFLFLLFFLGFFFFFFCNFILLTQLLSNIGLFSAILFVFRRCFKHIESKLARETANLHEIQLCYQVLMARDLRINNSSYDFHNIYYG